MIRHLRVASLAALVAATARSRRSTLGICRRAQLSKNCTSPLMVFSVDRGLATLDNLDAAPTFDAFRFTRAAPPA